MRNSSRHRKLVFSPRSEMPMSKGSYGFQNVDVESNLSFTGFSDDGARIICRWSWLFGCLGLRQDDGLALRARGGGFCGKAGSGLRRSAFLFSGVAS